MFFNVISHQLIIWFNYTQNNYSLYYFLVFSPKMLTMQSICSIYRINKRTFVIKKVLIQLFQKLAEVDGTASLIDLRRVRNTQNTLIFFQPIEQNQLTEAEKDVIMMYYERMFVKGREQWLTAVINHPENRLTN